MELQFLGLPAFVESIRIRDGPEPDRGRLFGSHAIHSGRADRVYECFWLRLWLPLRLAG